jgi:hypothetical protein
VLLEVPGGAEAGEHGIHVRPKRVAVSCSCDHRTCGPAPSFDHLAIPKPGAAVLTVREIWHKPGKWIEGGCGPFPHLPHHLPASKCRVGVGQRSHIQQVASVPINVAQVGRRGCIAPRVCSLGQIRGHPSRSRAVSTATSLTSRGTGSTRSSTTWFAHGGNLPLCFSGEPPPPPPAVGGCLIPVTSSSDVIHRMPCSTNVSIFSCCTFTLHYAIRERR